MPVQPAVEVPTDDTWLEASVPAVAPEKPAEKSAEPAPEKKSEAPAPTPATPPKEEPKAPEVTPPVEESAAPAPVSDDKTQAYIKELHALRLKEKEDNSRLLEELARMTAALQEAKNPEKALSPEEVDRRKKEESEALLSDPSAFLQKREKEIREKMEKDLTDKTRKDMSDRLGFKDVEEMETHFAADRGFRSIEKSVDAEGKPRYPLLADDGFKELMKQETNLRAVFGEFDKNLRPSEVLADRRFWAMAYQRAALDYTAKKLSSTPSGGGNEPAEPLNPISASPPSTPPAPKTPTAKAAMEDEWGEVEGAGVKVL